MNFLALNTTNYFDTLFTYLHLHTVKSYSVTEFPTDNDKEDVELV